MLLQELIRIKRDGQAWTGQQIDQLVEAISDGSLGDDQLGALAMAVYWRGLGSTETTRLTCAMRDSGDVLRWPGDLQGPLVDKHSTGGVGDATSLLIGPWAAACGAHVPMISGRGLGHTGGTLDKLATIPGYQAFPDPERFRRAVREVGVAIIGQTKDLAPADRRLYAVRDVTATVDSLPLIVASILGKKLAEGLDGLVLDVKTGSGAFMADPQQAQHLAETLVATSRQAGTPATALLTNMDQPLATTAGNALEVMEVLELLSGRRRGGRLYSLSRSLTAQMLQIVGLAENRDAALEQLDRAWQRGEPAERFGRMIHTLGGPTDLLSHPGRILPQAPVIRPVYAQGSGLVQTMDMRAIGWTVVALGGGRQRATDPIDPAVGLSELVRPGQRVDDDHPLALIHARSDDDAAAAALRVQAAVRLGDVPPVDEPLVLRVIDSEPCGD